MAYTAGDLITRAVMQLHGFGASQDRVTSLNGAIGATDTTLTVNYASGQSVGITPGPVEIDSELLYITNVDQTTGICTIAAGIGRGFRDTTATAHADGSLITSRPAFPRSELLRQMNDIIGSVFPELFAVATYTGTVTYPSNTYTLPSTPARLIDAQWQDPVGNWQRCQAYMLDPFDQTFRLGSGAMIGRPLRVVYATEPVQFSAETDLFSTTGLPDSCADLLVLGTVAKQVPALDIARAQTKSAEQSDRSKVVPPFAGENAAKYIMAEYQERLANEAASLRKRYGTRLVRTW